MSFNEAESKKKRPRYVAPEAPRNDTGKATRAFTVSENSAVFVAGPEGPIKVRGGGIVQLTSKMARFHQKNGSIFIPVEDFEEDFEDEGSTSDSGQSGQPGVLASGDAAATPEGDAGDTAVADRGESGGRDKLPGNSEAKNSNPRRRRADAGN